MGLRFCSIPPVFFLPRNNYDSQYSTHNTPQYIYITDWRNEPIYQDSAELHGDGHHVLHQSPLPNGNLERPAVRTEQAVSDVHCEKPNLWGEWWESVNSYSLSR